MAFPDPPNSSPQAPTIIIAPPPRVSAIRVAVSILAILFALFLGLLVLIVIGIETGPVALMLGFITATIPVPLYVILVLWIDRYEAEPLWMLATAFFWGRYCGHVLRVALEHDEPGHCRLTVECKCRRGVRGCYFGADR
ncbi:MAG: hypothetical protein LC794_07975 [Acidobacteria bacterium]|nr:hypothetical protein [Acidobacteriota bacterium]